LSLPVGLGGDRAFVRAQALGWSQYQVRSDIAIRRDWQLVLCAFTFCWQTCAELLGAQAPAEVVLDQTANAASAAAKKTADTGKKGVRRRTTPPVVAGGVKECERVARTMGNAAALLESILREAPARRVESAA
jgi:hypothetical protein